MIKGTDPVGADDQKPVAQVVHVANLTAAAGQRQVGLQQCAAGIELKHRSFAYLPVDGGWE
jgi:hypothetical protein